MMTFVFELGKVLIKLELSKQNTVTILRELKGEEKETILLQKVGKFWNQQNIWDRPDGLVVVTSHRVVFLSKLKTIGTTTDFLSFPLELMKSIESTKVWRITPAIRFILNGKVFIFTLFSGADEIINTINYAKKHL